MSLRIDNRRDVLLLLLYSPGKTDAVNEPITGRTRLMKMLFLFKEEAMKHFRAGTGITDENFYEFFAWNFGPFSRDVYDDLMFFELRGFVVTNAADEEPLPESAAEWEQWLMLSRSDSDDESVSEYDEQTFRLTEKGQTFTAELYSSLSANQRRLLREFKARLAVVPLRALLKYVYENYASLTTHSQIKESVLGYKRNT